MKRIVLAGVVVALGGWTAPLAAGGPELSYYMTRDDCRQQRSGGCTPQSQPAVSVGYSIIYTLEDGTYLGADNGDWDGPRSTGPSISDITLTQGATVVADEVAQHWGSRLRDAIRGAIKSTSKLVPKHQLGRAATVLAIPGARVVAGVGSAI